MRRVRVFAPDFGEVGDRPGVKEAWRLVAFVATSATPGSSQTTGRVLRGFAKLQTIRRVGPLELLTVPELGNVRAEDVLKWSCTDIREVGEKVMAACACLSAHFATNQSTNQPIHQYINPFDVRSVLR